MRDGSATASATKVGAVCTVIAGQSPKAAFYNDTGNGLPFYQGKKDFTERYIGPPKTWTTNVTKRAEPGDILMSVRAPVGPINEATEEICIGRGLAAIRPSEAIDRNYLWHALLWLQPEIKGNAGAVFDSINKAGIEKLEIPLPPLEEQRRIVAILDKAFEGLDRARVNAEVNLQNARELFPSLLDEVFAREDWPELALQDLAHENCTLSYGVVQPGDDVEGGLPIVRPVDLDNDEIGLKGLKRINPERASSYSRTQLDGTELLLCVRGSTGTISLASEELSGANVTRGIVPIRFNDRMHRLFGFFQFRSRHMHCQIAEKTYGAALMQINIRDVRKLRLRCPEMSEQMAAVERMESIGAAHSELLLAAQSKLADLNDLRQSLLQKAFAGELT